ncbi:hypothetical protein NMG60_11000872 [Bertholletia excelsa]
MSNNLVSQPLSIPDKQMDPIYDRLETSIPNMQMGVIGGMPNFTTGQQFEISNNEMGSVEAFCHNVDLQNLPIVNRQMGQMQPNVSNPGRQQFLIPNQSIGGTEAMLGNVVSQSISLPSKRKRGELMFSDSVAKQQSVTNKHVGQMESFRGTHGVQQLSTPSRKTLQVQTKSNPQNSPNLPASNKKMARNDSISGKTGNKQAQTARGRSIQTERSPKAQNESFESVRSKMRESLTAALALVTQQQGKASQERKPENSDGSNREQIQQESQPGESSSAVKAVDHVYNNATDAFPAKDDRTVPQGVLTNVGVENSAQACKGDEQETPCNSLLPNEDAPFGESFFAKDDLLQGNGLAWALDFDVEMGETREVQTAKKPKLDDEDLAEGGKEQAGPSPQSLAFKIELELFKLFGGVNKKYKEKGRSLLFNLKDRNNPELRERVMSGEIAPEKLCSMTAEELASKELSEWRIAKAEELAQMVVLPDSDVDIRRLVKKTHKGEFQVEVEQDDGVAVEVSVGASSLTRVQRKKETEVQPSSKTDGTRDKESVTVEKSSSENEDVSGRLTIPNDGTDLMQGLMVDEFKDAEFLPPIVSLDEFMESLDSEPPFENLSVDDGKSRTPTDKDSSEGGSDLSNSNLASKDKVDATLQKYAEDVKNKKMDMKMKPSVSSLGRKSSPIGAEFKTGHCFWRGVLQLNPSAMVAIGGFFRSGERTLTNEWPSCLEIKGRVRLDAFEKFIQELPMSRSRAVMVAHFDLEEGSSDEDRGNITEVVHSYVLDERLGFAEPAPGVEIYFCPPHLKLFELLGKHLPKDHTDTLNSIDNGLIGIVVWRKAQITSAISPNSSSHHKHGSKRQQHFSSSRRMQERDLNANVNISSKPNLPSPTPAIRTQPPPPPDDDDDDIPPGFGPAPAREDDDLPEFNFSGAPKHPPPKVSSHAPLRGLMVPRQVDQVRELIQKYGNSGSNSPSTRGVGIGVQPWNEEDDDDIPEWQPQAHQMQKHRHHSSQPSLHNYHQPLESHVMGQLPRVGPGGGAMTYQPPVKMAVQGSQNPSQAWQQGGRWVEPSGGRGVPPGLLGRQTGGFPRSRGF